MKSSHADPPDGQHPSTSLPSSSSSLHVHQLAAHTNLNVAPDNWLTLGGQFNAQQWVHGDKTNDAASKQNVTRASPMTSFLMANSHLDAVGDVDVIASQESVKQLLALPYSGDEERLSVMVHRVGRTLMIDNCDTKRLIRKQDNDLTKLRQFVSSQMSTSRDNTASTATLNDKLMHSKFIYHSLDTKAITTGTEQLALPAPKLPPTSARRTDVFDPDPLENNDTSFDSLAAVDLQIPASITERNVEWTFEDIRMLINTDMPIFGCGKHPCVSLKLRDMSRPINVLTGIDYWLDGLMCNVPEVLMCYHLDGIVQKYELIKTEDLPDVTDGEFDPQLIHDVASNLLSFLKSNATKEGHTYWLFKADDDDVVKLYDLTSVCGEFLKDHTADVSDANPFTLPVAVLMYRVARNLLRLAQTTTQAQQRRAAQDGGTTTPSTEQSPIRRVANAVYRLLHNCLDLLTPRKYPEVVGAVQCLLANLYMVLASETTSAVATKSNVEVNPESGPNSDVDGLLSTGLLDENWRPTQTTGDNLHSISMQLLIGERDVRHVSPTKKGHRRRNNTLSTASPRGTTATTSGTTEATPPSTSKSIAAATRLPNCSTVDDCCKRTLEHVHEGLQCVQLATQNTHDKNAAPRREDEGTEEVPCPKPADRSHPIPLPYLNNDDVNRLALIPYAVRRPTQSTWQTELTSLLLVRASIAYRQLAERALTLSHLGTTIRLCQNAVLCASAVLCLESTKNRVVLASCAYVRRVLLPSCITHAADANMMLSGVLSNKDVFARHIYDLRNNLASFRDTQVLGVAKKLCEQNVQSAALPTNEFDWLLTTLCTSLPNAVDVAQRAYECATKMLTEAAIGSKSASTQQRRQRRHSDSSVTNDTPGGAASNATTQTMFTQYDSTVHCPTVALTLSTTEIDRRSGFASNALAGHFVNQMQTILCESEGEEESNDSRLSRMTAVSEKALEQINLGVRCMRRADDATNEALIRANEGQVYRILARAHFKPTEVVGVAEQRWLEKSIDTYKRAVDLMPSLDKLRSTKRTSVNIPPQLQHCHSPDFVVAMTANLRVDVATMHFQTAQQMQDRPPTERIDVLEIQRSIRAHLHSALEQFEAVDDLAERTGLATLRRSRDTALQRSFTAHYRLASMYNRMYIEECTAEAQPSRKTARSKQHVAALHYTRAAQIYNRRMTPEMRSVDLTNDALRAQLERVGMIEMQMQQMPPLNASNYAAHMRILCEAMHILLLDSQPMLDYLKEYTILYLVKQCPKFAFGIRLYVGQVQSLCKALLQLVKSEGRTNDLSPCKSAYATALRLGSFESLEQRSSMKDVCTTVRQCHTHLCGVLDENYRRE